MDTKQSKAIPRKRRNPRRADDVGQIVNSIREILGSLERYSKELKRSFHITGPQLGVLRVVHRFPATTLGELSQRMYLHISTVSGITDRLEAGGYLLRQRSEQDRRVVHLRLTEKGKRTIALSPPSGFGLMVRNLEKLPAGELRKIRRAMQTLHKLTDVDTDGDRPAGAADGEFSE
jgi:MarR family transcriptional regulator, organic hydroperoxide resistance regulator